MADYWGHILLAAAGIGITASALMEMLTPRTLGPVILGWLGLMITALTIAHAINTTFERFG